MTLKTALLLAPASIKRLGDLQALSVSASCLTFGPNDCKIVLQPCSGYVPKVLTTPFRAQVISLLALPATDGYQWPNLPCPVWENRVYFEYSKSFRQSEQLFVCFGSCSKGLLVKKAISLDSGGYRPSLCLGRRTVPYRSVGHSTRGISSSWAWSLLERFVRQPAGRRCLPLLDYTVLTSLPCSCGYYRLNANSPPPSPFGQKRLLTSGPQIPLGSLYSPDSLGPH